VPVNDSTLGDLFHATARGSNVLYERLLAVIAADPLVLADETQEPVLAKGKTRTAWIWDFIAKAEGDKTSSPTSTRNSRSGETPLRVLANTTGKLLVDGYTAYNKVTVQAAGSAPDATRTRGGSSSRRSPPHLPRRGRPWTSSWSCTG